VLAVVFALAAGLIGYYFAFSREWPAGPALVVAAALFLLPGFVLRLVRRRS
jgi:ABC-type Mn2+/Zn2+ transport system permease subunit